MSDNQQKSSIQIGLRSFVTACAILLSLMILSGILTRVIPSGHYERVQVEGRSMVVQDSYGVTPKESYPVWRWFTAPIEVFWGDNWLMVMVLSLFMIFIGGAFTVMEQGRIIESIMALLINRFRKRKYLLMGVIMFVMMFLASVIGIYEAMIPTIIFIVPLSLALGWDSLVGLGMTLLALSFGFSAAVTNPFTIGVAQNLADLPLFSGSWLRIIFFLIIYGLGYLYVYRYARKIEKDPEKSLSFKEDELIRHRYSAEKLMANLDHAQDKRMKKAIVSFSVCLLLALAVLFYAALSPTIPTDYAFPVLSLLFLLGGILAGRAVGIRGLKLLGTLGRGGVSMAPGILLIVMAMSIPHIMTRGGVMDTILFRAGEIIEGTGLYTAGFLVYLLTLMLNFFISSASAKAFLIMPILVPLADLLHLTRQTVILAFDLGDGFSNIIFPTNALLLIALGFTSISYTRWIRWTWKVQLIIFGLSMAFLVLAVKIGFGPF
ncbi:MAG: YfcC family protein [Spirochaetales bacterium]|nr:YfcC family protein [Spirochaetales bacterium]